MTIQMQSRLQTIGLQLGSDMGIEMLAAVASLFELLAALARLLKMHVAVACLLEMLAAVASL